MAGDMLFQLPLKNDTSRKIIHLDMDAFYASIEERDEPAYHGKALVIARDPKFTGGKGVVATANYVARSYGVHSAMPALKAVELVPKNKLIFKTPDFTKYRAVSDQIHEIFHTVTDIIEPVAFDEAYLDVTKNKRDIRSTVALARTLQREIQQATQLTSSVGISYNKFLAKMASDYCKPVGRTVILPEQAIAFLQRLPIEKFHGVGKKTVPKMNDLGVFTGKDLLACSQMQLIQLFGKMGYALYRHARGIDERPVEYLRERKSAGKESTYGKLLLSEEEVMVQLRILAKGVAASLLKNQKHGETVVLKVRNREFETITKRLTLGEFVASEEQIYEAAVKLWQQVGQITSGIRLLGITVTNLAPLAYENIELPLYDWDR